MMKITGMVLIERFGKARQRGGGALDSGAGEGGEGCVYREWKVFLAVSQAGGGQGIHYCAISCKVNISATKNLNLHHLVPNSINNR